MDKKGVSEFVAYVFLIIIVITIAVLVYSVLKGYMFKPSVECNDENSLKLIGYSCNNNKITINMRNTGLFDLDGFLAKISVTDKKPGLTLGDANGNFFERALKPGDNYTKTFVHAYENMTELEIIPLKIINKDVVLCQKARTTIELENCSLS